MSKYTRWMIIRKKKRWEEGKKCSGNKTVQKVEDGEFTKEREGGKKETTV